MFNFEILLLTGDAEDDQKIKRHKTTSLAKNGSTLEALFSLRNMRPKAGTIFHYHSLSPLLLGCLFFRKFKGIYHCHCMYPWLTDQSIKSRTKRALLKAAYQVLEFKSVCVSSEIRDVLQNNLSIPTKYIPNGIENSGTQRKPFLNSKFKEIKFYSVTRLDPEKKITLAIDMLDQVQKLMPQRKITFDIYGDGQERPAIESHLNSRTGADIRMKGYTQEAHNLPEHYDFYISTSSQEGLSLSALQALRGKTPLFTTKVGQIGLDIDDQKNGFLLDFNVDKSANRIFKGLSLSPGSLSKIQNDAFNLYIENYSADIFRREIQSIYS